MTHGSVAKKVRLRKEAHPEEFCSAGGCLWRVSSGKCPKHPLAPIHMGRVAAEHDDAFDERDEFSSLPEVEA
jgi:hypothetical protein